MVVLISQLYCVQKYLICLNSTINVVIVGRAVTTIVVGALHDATEVLCILGGQNLVDNIGQLFLVVAIFFFAPLTTLAIAAVSPAGAWQRLGFHVVKNSAPLIERVATIC